MSLVSVFILLSLILFFLTLFYELKSPSHITVSLKYCVIRIASVLFRIFCFIMFFIFFIKSFNDEGAAVVHAKTVSEYLAEQTEIGYQKRALVLHHTLECYIRVVLTGEYIGSKPDLEAFFDVLYESFDDKQKYRFCYNKTAQDVDKWLYFDALSPDLRKVNPNLYFYLDRQGGLGRVPFLNDIALQDRSVPITVSFPKCFKVDPYIEISYIFKKFEEMDKEILDNMRNCSDFDEYMASLDDDEDDDEEGDEDDSGDDQDSKKSHK